MPHRLGPEGNDGSGVNNALKIAASIIEGKVDPGTGAAQISLLTTSEAMPQLQKFRALAGSWESEPGLRDMIAVEIRSAAATLLAENREPTT